LDQGQTFSDLANNPRGPEIVEAINEFCSVLQGALHAARMVADKDSRVHHKDAYKEWDRLNFFIARECAKTLVRSTPEAQDEFLQRWAKAGNTDLGDQESSHRGSTDGDSAHMASEHEESKSPETENLKKSTIAAAAAYDIAKALRKTKVDKRRHNIETAAHWFVVPALVEMFVIPAYGDKITLHPDIRKQFKGFKPDFIYETPPQGFHWNVPEVIEDLSKLPTKLHLTGARFNKGWIATVTDACRTKSHAQHDIMNAWNVVANTEAFANKNISDYIRADIESAKEKLRNDAYEKLFLKLGTQLVEFINKSTEPPKAAYITYEATNESGAKQYFRIPFKVLIQGDAAKVNRNFSGKELQKALYAAVATLHKPTQTSFEDTSGRRITYQLEAPFWNDLNGQYQSEKLVDHTRTIDLGLLAGKNFRSGFVPKTEEELKVLSNKLEKQRRDIEDERQALAKDKVAAKGVDASTQTSVDARGIQTLVTSRLASIDDISTAPSTNKTRPKSSLSLDEPLDDKIKRLDEEHKKAVSDFAKKYPPSSSLIKFERGATRKAREGALANIKDLREQLTAAQDEAKKAKAEESVVGLSIAQTPAKKTR